MTIPLPPARVAIGRLQRLLASLPNPSHARDDVLAAIRALEDDATAPGRAEVG